MSAEELFESLGFGLDESGLVGQLRLDEANRLLDAMNTVSRAFEDVFKNIYPADVLGGTWFPFIQSLMDRIAELHSESREVLAHSWKGKIVSVTIEGANYGYNGTLISIGGMGTLYDYVVAGATGAIAFSNWRMVGAFAYGDGGQNRVIVLRSESENIF